MASRYSLALVLWLVACRSENIPDVVRPDAVCGAGQALCGASCVDPQSDPAHCGGCGSVCGGGPGGIAQCRGGRCRLFCSISFLDCNSRPEDGCEVDLSRHPQNCGACGLACPAMSGVQCREGRCVASCDAAHGDCNELPDDACETTFATDLDHCGQCGNACSAGMGASAVCENGRCGQRCLEGYADCDRDAENGCESYLRSPVHCGGCGRSCAASTPFCAQTAAGMSCVDRCPEGTAMCWQSCVVLDSDLEHCGSCGQRCVGGVNATPVCRGGMCALRCRDGFADCDANVRTGCETSLRSNASHCGACGRVCVSGENSSAFCASGQCVLRCASGHLDCDRRPETGCEVDLRSNSNHCGGCGRVCAAGECCREGQCVAGPCGAMDAGMDGGIDASADTMDVLRPLDGCAEGGCVRSAIQTIPMGPLRGEGFFGRAQYEPMAMDLADAVLVVSSAYPFNSADRNNQPDLYRVALRTGQIDGPLLAALNPNAEQLEPGLSSDGNQLVFSTVASNLSPADTNAFSDVYLWTISSRTLRLVSRGGNAASDRPTISGDGRWVLFESAASNLVVGDTNGQRDAFLYDVTMDRLERLPLLGTMVSGGVSEPRISRDGNFVVFHTTAALLAEDTNTGADVYRFDRRSGALRLVSVPAEGMQVQGNAESPRCSADASVVSFNFVGSGLVAGAATGTNRHLYMRDMERNRTELLSRSFTGGAARSGSSGNFLSEDGNLVGFTSSSGDLLAGPSASTLQTYYFDRRLGRIESTSRLRDGRNNDGDALGTIPSPSGRFHFVATGNSQLLQELRGSPGEGNLWYLIMRPFVAGGGFSASDP